MNVQESHNESIDTATIGDVMICNCPNTHSDGTHDGTYKIRPVMIWGVYRDSNDTIVAFDVFGTTTQTQKINLSSLFVLPGDFSGDRNEKNAIINSEHIATLPIDLFDTRKGIVSSLNPNLVPDLISCRANAVNANPSNRYLNHCDFEDGDYREGIFLNQSLVRPIRSSNNPDSARPDIENIDPNKPACEDSWLNQNEINAITRWSVAYIKILKQNNLQYKWPAKGTWPNWPDVEMNGEIIRCCSDKTAAKRDYQPVRKPKFLSAAMPRP